MKKLTALLLFSVILLPILAQNATTNSAPAQTGTTEASAGADSAAYARMTRREVELSTEMKVLTDFAEVLLKRADDVKAAFPDRAKWQTELAQEVRDRASTRLKELNQGTSDRLAWENAHAPAKPTALGVGSLDQAKPLTPDEFAYLTKLEERTLFVRQELAATLDYGKTFALELSTNTAPEAVFRISAMVDRNNALIKLLQRDQSELELKQLEFRALRR